MQQFQDGELLVVYVDQHEEDADECRRANREAGTTMRTFKRAVDVDGLSVDVYVTVQRAKVRL